MNKRVFSNNKNLMTVGVIAAISASLCCITPVLGVLGGIGGLASTFSWLQPIRPYIISLTTIVLGFAWYQKLKTRNRDEIACECDVKENLSFSQSKFFLGIVTLFAVVLLSFPYYSDIFFHSLNADAIIVEQENLATTQMKVVGMTCSGCEHSVNKAIKELTGVIEVVSHHKTGLLRIKYDKSKVKPRDFKNVIENTLGYTVSSITEGE
ncbi:MAG TPA: mercuric transport protein MerTP [Leptospiraceae bacterium]|nr:mercuric transport protein MerTP [Leptospiraceae bacterium]HNC59555.1 mercuric transport protein MerTP [Leptospiraceae bacterium]HNE11411.1 mercuric transport protein MerTP [Leptospiraceae bacterium]HNF57771.1 mercuric transport protein MerTP [Leptospiraceae bacterium]HNH02943.1 mercuric transport protein MerTP [Leptospiraceae bacterium]